MAHLTHHVAEHDSPGPASNADGLIGIASPAA